MDNEAKKLNIHPLMAVATIAVILVCLTGIAAMFGLLPNFGKAPNAPNADLTANPAAVANTTVEPKQAAPAPVKKTVIKKPATVVSHVAPTPVAPLPPRCFNCGVVEFVRTVQQQVPTSGVGAAAGALLGGVLGHQVGGGNGKTLATIAGAVGGGFAGNAVERNTHTSASYEVVVRMEDGSRQSFMMNEQRWRSGDLVRVENGNLLPR